MNRLDLVYELINSMDDFELDSLKGNKGYISIYKNDEISIDWWVGTNMFQEVDDIGASIIMINTDGFELLEHCRKKYKISDNDYEKLLHLIGYISFIYVD